MLKDTEKELSGERIVSWSDEPFLVFSYRRWNKEKIKHAVPESAQRKKMSVSMIKGINLF